MLAAIKMWYEKGDFGVKLMLSLKVKDLLRACVRSSSGAGLGAGKCSLLYEWQNPKSVYVKHLAQDLPISNR